MKYDKVLSHNKYALIVPNKTILLLLYMESVAFICNILKPLNSTKISKYKQIIHDEMMYIK